MASRRNRPLFLGIGIVVVASLWRAAATESERHRLAGAYADVQRTAKQLEAERTQLSTELAQSKQALQQQTANIDQLQQQLASVQIRMDQTTTELASLKQTNEDLVTQKQQLEAKLSSIKELRLAIRQLNHKLWAERWTAWRTRIAARREADREQLASGNRGYLVRDGNSTFATRPRLTVHVLDPQSQ